MHRHSLTDSLIRRVQAEIPTVFAEIRFQPVGLRDGCQTPDARLAKLQAKTVFGELQGGPGCRCSVRCTVVFCKQARA